MATPRKIAICIGINDYPGTSSDLSGCVNDARDWAEELRARGFECRMLLDAQATGRAIRAALEGAAADAQPGDIVVVTNSSHGTFVPDLDGDEDDGHDECWCPHDVAANGPISDDELSAVQGSRREGVRWIVISDSCHSGTVARFAPIATPPTSRAASAPQRLVRFLPPQTFMQDRVLRRFAGDASAFYAASPPGRNGVLLMSGCQDAEYSFDAWFEGRPNGAFSFIALRELQRLPRHATYADWHAAIRRLLPSQQYAQSPNLYGPPEMRDWQVFAAEAEERPHGPSSGGTANRPEGPGKGPQSSPPRDGVPFRQQLAAGRFAAASIVMHRDTLLRKRTLARNGEASTSRTLVCEGDSWFDFPWANVLTCLEDRHGHEIFSVAHNGHTLEQLAYDDRQSDDLLRTIERLVNRNIQPDAILLSGGGNDIAGPEFAQILNHRDSSTPGLNQSVLAGVIDERLRDGYAYLIGMVAEFCHRRLGRHLPIILHGYDFPTPDGRGFLGGFGPLPGPWLQPSLNRKGYRDPVEMKQYTTELINRFNAMQARLVADLNLDFVHHIDLRDTIPAEEGHREWWADELHPTEKGFRLIAQRCHDVILRVTPKP